MGNQLWQIASTMGIARALGQPCAFPDTWSYRPYFSVPDAFFPPGEIEGVHAADLVHGVDERHRVYLQDHGLWRGMENVVRHFFRPSQRARDQLFQPELDWFHDLGENKISLHVRRGDNVVSGPEYYPLPTMGYYRRALERLPEDWPVVVFSDEIAWCRQQLPELLAGRPHFFFEGTPRPKEHEAAYETAPVLDWLDLFLQAGCSRHIISNSTYSWWGAWLSNDPEPVYPDAWYGPMISAYADPSPMFVDERWKCVAVSPA